MKAPWPLMTLALSTVMMAPVRGGVLTYVAIPAQNSDTQAGLRGEGIYTSAVDTGNIQGADRIINGVALHPLKGDGNTAIADHVTITVASGALANVTIPAPGVQADGSAGAALSDAITNDQADDNSEEYVVLDPASLKRGETYDLRVYIAPLGESNRLVNLSFLGDGQEPVGTDFFNEDDATSVPGKFTATNQAYYINFRYTWDGTTTPGFTVTQKTGKNPFLLFALTNQVATIQAAAPQTAFFEAPPPTETAETAGATDTTTATQGSAEVATTSGAEADQTGAPADTNAADAPAPNATQPIGEADASAPASSQPVANEDLPPSVQTQRTAIADATGPESFRPVSLPKPPPASNESAEVNVTTDAVDTHVSISSRKAVSVDAFYADANLARTGHWVEIQGYGRCWQPAGVPVEWKPYTVGSWEYATEVGWIWTSPEPWALYTYHYGRWIYNNDAGWCWVPGIQWAPAWCSWRVGHGFIGWAPLPPGADLAVNGTINATVDSTYHIDPSFYSFCKVDDFGAEKVSDVLVTSDQAAALVVETQNITAFSLRHGVVFCGGPKYEVIHALLKKAHHHDIALVNAASFIRPNFNVDLHPKHLPNVAAHYKFAPLASNLNSVKTPKMITPPTMRHIEDHKPNHVTHFDVAEHDSIKKAEIRDREREHEKPIVHPINSTGHVTMITEEHEKPVVHTLTSTGHVNRYPEEHVNPVVIAPPQNVVIKRPHPPTPRFETARCYDHDRYYDHDHEDHFRHREEWMGHRMVSNGPRPMSYSYGRPSPECHHGRHVPEDFYAAEQMRFGDHPRRY